MKNLTQSRWKLSSTWWTEKQRLVGGASNWVYHKETRRETGLIYRNNKPERVVRGRAWAAAAATGCAGVPGRPPPPTLRRRRRSTSATAGCWNRAAAASTTRRRPLSKKKKKPSSSTAVNFHTSPNLQLFILRLSTPFVSLQEMATSRTVAGDIQGKNERGSKK